MHEGAVKRIAQHLNQLQRDIVAISTLTGTSHHRTLHSMPPRPLLLIGVSFDYELRQVLCYFSYSTPVGPSRSLVGSRAPRKSLGFPD
jgi:hypothetical protein